MRATPTAERASERDRRFFRDNPTETSYLRRYAPGEFPPKALASIGAKPPERRSWVLVKQIVPGFRVRQPIGRIVAGRPKDGRMTVIGPDGLIAENVRIVGWMGVGS
jgi:hypothetical protein